MYGYVVSASCSLERVSEERLRCYAAAGRSREGHALQVPGDHAYPRGDGLRDRELGGMAVLQEFMTSEAHCYGRLTAFRLMLSSRQA